MKRYILLTFILSVVLIETIHAQDITYKKTLPGSWLGKLVSNGVELRLVFNMKLNEQDSIIATLDSPDQGAKNIPLGRVSLNDKKLNIKAPLLLGEYNGTVKSDSIIEGTWTQRGKSFDVNLNKLNTPFVLRRPQEPRPPFPYTSEDVTFNNEKFNIRLSGTLTLPAGKGPFKAVIMITGSGPQNRNEELMGHKPFLVIADYLSRNGIAVLRFDDRGVGRSQGNYSSATSGDLATDAEAAFDYLKKDPRIDPRKIGFIGHSEGGLIAPIVASSNPDIAFIVSLAGPGVTGQQLILRQSRDIGRLSGEKENSIKAANEINKKLYAVLRKESDNKKAEIKIISIYQESLKKQKISPEESEKAIKQLKSTFGADSYTWFRYFIMTDPSWYWKKVKCPVFALNGDKDVQVAADENLNAIERALKSRGNKSVKVVKLTGLNHLFQHCNNGLPSEYGTIEETFSPEALRIISDWILSL